MSGRRQQIFYHSTHKACSSTAPASPRVSSQASLSPSVFFLSITLFPGKKQHTESEIGFAGSENGNRLRSFADQWFPRDRRLRVRIGAGNWVINGMLRFSSYKVCVRVVFVMF